MDCSDEIGGGDNGTRSWQLAGHQSVVAHAGRVQSLYTYREGMHAKDNEAGRQGVWPLKGWSYLSFCWLLIDEYRQWLLLLLLLPSRAVVTRA